MITCWACRSWVCRASWSFALWRKVHIMSSIRILLKLPMLTCNTLDSSGLEYEHRTAKALVQSRNFPLSLLSVLNSQRELVSHFSSRAIIRRPSSFTKCLMLLIRPLLITSPNFRRSELLQSHLHARLTLSQVAPKAVLTNCVLWATVAFVTVIGFNILRPKVSSELGSFQLCAKYVRRTR
jgi:hypothetical protein